MPFLNEVTLREAMQTLFDVYGAPAMDFYGPPRPQRATITQAQRDAWTKLDQARTVAWRTWRKTFRSAKAQGHSFEECFNEATNGLLRELEPYYQKCAPKWRLERRIDYIPITFEVTDDH